DCPNDASAAIVAKKLKDKGFRHVRPLAGGMDAWVAQGRPIDR
ncbi:MAG: sulfurtransferase, partial [Peristeroidobacter soli]